MTIEEAREEIPCEEIFEAKMCAYCGFDGYCPNRCYELLKFRKLDFERVVKCYARNGGEMHKVIRFIKDAKI